ncbi:MAG: carboxypeptidase regulatory-like domain-containing protein [Candidatus Tenebribacter burtonii]|nr:carboxypeptidase regulatory-like domain-containing protein [Candidatus Tenebribacter burtonii]
MKTNSKILYVILMIIVTTSISYAANLTSNGHSNGNGGPANLRPVNWIETDSGLPQGFGVGQISIGMNDQESLWAMAIDNTGAVADNFTRSTDSGENWTAGTFNAGTGLSQIFAVDDMTCWAVFNTGADQGLYKTTDGGANWINMNAGYGASSFTNVIHFFNDNDGFAQGDPIDGYYELYTTTNGGDNWTRVPEADIPVPTTGEFGITGNYYAVGDNIWYGTNLGRIFYSTDKGYTWDVTMTPFGSANTVTCIFSDALNGFAFRSYLNMGIEPEIDITTDGGQTYTPLFVTGDMYARWFSHVPGTTSTFVGSSSEPGFEGASYSEDGGNTWITLNSGVAIQATAFLDAETGWAGNWAGATSGGMYIFDGNLNVITGEIEGTVTDLDEGFAIEGAVITLGTFSTTTDVNGDYNMIMDIGTFTLTSEIDGYEVYTQDNVVIEEDEITTVDFQMQNLYLPPQNLTYIFNAPNVVLNWDVPVGSIGLSGYKVYRNGAMLSEINNVSATLYVDQNVPTGNYTYYLTAMYGTHESVPSNEVEVEVVDAGNILPANGTTLNGNVPNPFNPTTTISFSLETAGYVNIDIYNVKGEKVRTLVDENLEATSHSVVWDGKDDLGRTTSSGVYFYKMKTGSFTSTKKMVLMK